MGKRFNGWLLPWAASATVGIFVFATAHQFLVAWAPGVHVGVPVALVLSIPIVAAYAALLRDRAKPPGTVFGLVVFAGLVPHYALITIAMRADMDPKPSEHRVIIPAAVETLRCTGTET
jgi:hypothetical protein